MKNTTLYSLLFFLLLCCMVLTLSYGDTSWESIWNGVQERWIGVNQEWNPLLDERLPRLIVILCTGASLAVSGAIMQSLFHNPLASPSVLGISCGGSLCVVVVFVMGWHLEYPYAVPMASFLGCLTTLMLVYMMSRIQGGVHVQSLILTGIALSTLLLAIQGAIMYALRDRWQLIQTLTEWESGSTTDRSWKHVHMQLPLTIVGLLGSWLYSREIDILALGEEEAKILGVDVQTVRWRLFLCISLLTGGAIAAVGIIAFFGLVLPHVLRRISGPNARVLIPLCMLAGSTTLLAMDITLRICSLHAFSIGNVSAILGGLFFVILLFGSRHRSMEARC